jgi:hypothetical protein
MKSDEIIKKKSGPLKEVKESVTPCGRPEGGALWSYGLLALRIPARGYHPLDRGFAV